MMMERIPKRAFWLWEVTNLLAFCVVLSLTLYIFRPYTLVWYALLWLLGAVFILMSFLYLPLLYLASGYALTQEYLVVSKGVIMHKTHYLSLNQVSFVSVYTNPLTKLIKLSTLVVTAPGGRVILLFMEHSKSLEISQKLSVKSKIEGFR